MFYLSRSPQKCPPPATVSMGTTLKAKRNSPEHRAIVLERLRQLSPHELEICLLHLVECHSKELIGDWLSRPTKHIQRHLTHAILKVPELRPLRVAAARQPKRRRFFQLSQLRPTERGPFNADEV